VTPSAIKREREREAHAMTYKCDWPNCQKTSDQPTADGWAFCGAFPEPGLTRDCCLCPEHAPKYEEAAIADCYGDADIILENGWQGTVADGGFATVGYDAVTERGEVFLSAYYAETEGEDVDDDVIIASGSILPEELPQFKRMAAAAGVKLQDRTREARSSSAPSLVN
jgi:hypothetical protein